MELSDLKASAKRSGKMVHIGRIFELCHEKGSELPAGHPGRKFKGRVVFMGNQVRDEENNMAIFNELSSAPATMESAKAADIYSVCPVTAGRLRMGTCPTSKPARSAPKRGSCCPDTGGLPSGLSDVTPALFAPSC